MNHSSIQFLSVDEILELHKKLIDRFGGQAGVRDEGLISSALYRPQSGYYNGIFEQAAALIQSLALNHPFLDGNKRVAFAACDVFLLVNGFELNVTVIEVENFLIGRIIKEKAEISEIASWIQKHSRELTA